MATPHCLHNTSQNKKKPGSQEATGRLLHFERAKVPARYLMTFRQ